MQPTYNALSENEGFADEIAEHAAALGAIAEETVQVAAKRSFQMPYPPRIADEKQHLFAVASTLAASGQSAREEVDLKCLRSPRHLHRLYPVAIRPIRLAACKINGLWFSKEGTSV